jgi:hypothetical protein
MERKTNKHRQAPEKAKPFPGPVQLVKELKSRSSKRSCGGELDGGAEPRLELDK